MSKQTKPVVTILTEDFEMLCRWAITGLDSAKGEAIGPARAGNKGADCFLKDVKRLRTYVQKLRRNPDYAHKQEI